jgi:hypothetical protein
MNAHFYQSEPLCATSERLEKLISDDEIRRITSAVGSRIIEAFNYRSEYEIAVLLKTSCKTVWCLTAGEELPPVEMLLCIHKLTGVSIDWLLTGEQAARTENFQMSYAVFEEDEKFEITLNPDLRKPRLRAGLW